MKKIIHLALRTGYTFKNVYGHLDSILEYGKESGAIGVADLAATYTHPMIEQKCAALKIKPIYAVRIPVVKDAQEKIPPRGQWGSEYIFIAKNKKGLREIYKLVRKYYENFYYRGNISYRDVYKLSKNVIVIAENFEKKKRIDYIALTPTTPKPLRTFKGIPKVAICNNDYPAPEDHETYNIFTSPRNNNNQTYPQYILNTDDWLEIYSDNPEAEDAIKNTHKIAAMCEVKLKKAPMIKYEGGETVSFVCKAGARKKKIDLKSEPYKTRYEFELKLIKEKQFESYFLVVAAMVKKSKETTLVGPSRGSAAGSLICYLMGITEIDPLEFGLLFERFIDINRNDFPDIDIDFPDKKREKVIKDLIKDYGEENVMHVANISTMQPKAAINEFAKTLCVPAFETESVKGSLIERFAGHERASKCLQDTFETTVTGKTFIETYPAMYRAAEVENHPRHTSVHAGGIIVCNENINKFVGVNARKEKGNNLIAMVDKKTAEYLNLLKIDVLGLRTLSVLEDCATMIDMNHEDFYKINLNHAEVFESFNKMQLAGIFQFEGDSVKQLTRKMGIQKFDDITALTALARPAALHSGGAMRYVKYRLGEEVPNYFSKAHEEITSETYSVIVYQEQILKVCREIGGMDWKDVNALRKALSKSLGKDYFNTFKEKFSEGAKKKNYKDEDIEFIWDEIQNSGEYAFNKSHSVAYALISYWCMYMKANYPKQFLVASLNNPKDEPSAIALLRDAVTNEGVEYIPIDPDESLKGWSINSSGMVVGGLLNIHGIGVQTANKIIRARSGGEKLTRGVIKKMIGEIKTPFDTLFPCREKWNDLYQNPINYGLSEAPSELDSVNEKGEYIFIGKLIEMNVRDLNSYEQVQKRNGQMLDDATLELVLKFEDDTGNILGSIGRFNFERIGLHIAENSTVDEDWFIVRGAIKYNSRFFSVDEMMLLNEKELFE